MNTVAGIFHSRQEAERAVENLRVAGIVEDNISLLTPGETEAQVESDVATSETEQPGMGKALGGTVGAAIGAAGGLHLGAAAASLFVPGVGPIIAAGILGAALLGAGGAATGVFAGGAMESGLAKGLPHDELYVYEDALRQGRSVVIVATDDSTQSDSVRTVLGQAGAESLDAARESWWVGLRDAEAEQYTGQGSDFKTDEPQYRRGFEAALHPQARSRSYDETADYLRERHADAYSQDAFKRGYERGQNYHRSLTEKHKG